MKVTRRDFMKVTGLGAVCIAFSQVGCAASKPVKTYASTLKIRGAKEVISICGFCSVSCHLICHVKDGRVISAEGDPGYPVSEGALCAKGAATLAMINSDHRLFKPLYRAPYSDRWEEKSWDWILNRLATRIKETRDRDFKQYNDKKQQVNRVESMFHLGSSQLDNEECALVHQAIRALGVVHFDHQARI
jgi:formate dehydrogenase major subunit